MQHKGIVMELFQGKKHFFIQVRSLAEYPAKKQLNQIFSASI